MARVSAEQGIVSHGGGIVQKDSKTQGTLIFLLVFKNPNPSSYIYYVLL